MAAEKWNAGAVGLAWPASIMTTELDSLVSGNAVLASSSLDNGTNLELFADFSVSLGSFTPTATFPYLGLYLYPKNQDGSTYGDGRFASSAAGPPPSSYWVGNIPLVASAGVQVGMVRGIVLPPGIFKPGAFNGSGATLASGSNVLKWRTYGRSVS